MLAALATAETLRCAYCGRTIDGGRYVQADGHSYHTDCYEKHVVPRCAFCNKPIEGRYVFYGGKNYHIDCYEKHIALRCDLCGAVIEGNHLTDFWGNHYCESHRGVVPECDYCGRFLGDRHNRGGITYSDGRHICNLCQKSAVGELSEAKAILEEVRRRLGQLGIVVEHKAISLRLTDKRAISRFFSGEMASHCGFVKHEYVRIGNLVTDQSFQIHILDGMPRMHYIATAAHELMHVWQYLNGPLGNDPALCEGSCNYASLMVLKQIGGAEADYLIESLRKNSDPVYGEGFRRVERLVRARGADGWLEHLRTSKYFPAGY